MEYDKFILNSQNKNRTTWNIINTESGRNKKSNNIHVLNVEDRNIVNQQAIAETFNKYFAAIAENVRKQIKYTHKQIHNNDEEQHIHFIKHAINNSFPNMESKYTTIKEIQNK
jgi:hypothetical protein